MATVALPIFHAFARSGGTLLNRCLGCISGNLVLSEVNPHRSVMPVELQARDWLGLLDERERAALAPQSYAEKIRAVLGKAIDRGKHLILRDWCSVNFLALPGPQSRPSGVLEQPLYLERFGIRLRPIVFARRAASVHTSLAVPGIDLASFARAYLTYARSVCDLPIFHYEAFCANPEELFPSICQALGMAYDPSFLYDFARFDNCTGDMANRANPTAAVNRKHIAPICPPRSHPKYMAASQDPLCQEADRLLGYEN